MIRNGNTSRMIIVFVRTPIFGTYHRILPGPLHSWPLIRKEEQEYDCVNLYLGFLTHNELQVTTMNLTLNFCEISRTVVVGTLCGYNPNSDIIITQTDRHQYST